MTRSAENRVATVKTNENQAFASTDLDLESLLWTDLSVYERKHEKAASAFAAISRALERNRPLEGLEDEFLSLARRFSQASNASVNAALRDPSAYHWARIGFDLALGCDLVIASAGARHLRDTEVTVTTLAALKTLAALTRVALSARPDRGMVS